MTRELLFSVTKRDLTRQTFRSGGKGGQNQNKRDTGVRWIHEPSGARGEARDQRSQGQNERAAFLRLVKSPLFQVWLKIQTGAIAAASVVREEDCLVEARQGGVWIPLRPHQMPQDKRKPPLGRTGASAP